MTAAGWVVLMAALMSLGFTVGHNHSGETDTYHVSVGRLFLLRCLFADAHTNVTWSREGRHDQTLPTGVEVRDGLLWFLPVQVSHNGSYTCEKRGTTGLSRMTFGVSVSNKECPDAPETISIIRGVNEGLPCKQKEIFRLKNTRKIRWMKECHPVEGQRKRVSVDENGLMRLSAASEQDAGMYTCLVDINLDGKMYTAARSIQLNIKNNTFIAKPEVMFPKGKVVVVEEADRSALYTSLALCLAASLAVLAVMAAFLFFKVDLVLAYRKLLRHFSKQQAPDGKLYDAYVSFLHPDSLSSAETAMLALQILPEELEKKHGYSLYIRGRDDCPGEAVHDVIAATVRQCRRLIIILSPEIKSSADGKSEEEPLYENQNQLCYEQKVGLHDALIQNEPQVILVEMGDSKVDYSCLSESLRYIRRKQGALTWKKPSVESHKLSRVSSNRKFWKNLRYHMPSVPAGTLQTFV
ncbi:interleukin-1 receptor-like 1 isoform X2 [Epinephelus moara]|uniref:interleukin-1 receptor-like 1 isoform X2 n=1 Tax=Epinephelus moara TaxID=300413 RepID=UPI00214DFB27|nr:interleukin-1 receptor-like 1 isoform X2 [Epinephelus moara]